MQIYMYTHTHTHTHTHTSIWERETPFIFPGRYTQFKHKFWQNFFITNLVKKAQRLHILLTENWMWRLGSHLGAWDLCMRGCHFRDGVNKTVWCSVMSNSLRPHGLQPVKLLCPRNSPGEDAGVGCISFSKALQGARWELSAADICYVVSVHKLVVVRYTHKEQTP